MKAAELEQLLVLLDRWSTEQPQSVLRGEWRVLSKACHLIEEDLDRARTREKEGRPAATEKS